MGNIKEINIKYRTYYFFDDMINIKDFDSNLLKIDKKSYKNIDIYYIGHITMKDSDYVKINSVNPLYLIIDNIEEKNGNKYLIFSFNASGNKDKEVLTKYLKLWDDIKYLIRAIHGGEEGEYRKDSMKIRLNSDNNLPLNKILKLHNMTLTFRSVFQEDGKYYPQVF